MSEFIDLDILFEKSYEKIKLNSKDGQEFKLTLETTPEMALSSIKLMRDGKTEVDSAIENVKIMLKDQLNVDKETDWIKKNIKTEYLLYIETSLAAQITEANNIIKSRGTSKGTKKK